MLESKISLLGNILVRRCGLWLGLETLRLVDRTITILMVEKGWGSRSCIILIPDTSHLSHARIHITFLG
jgi:hypothetical protein